MLKSLEKFILKKFRYYASSGQCYKACMDVIPPLSSNHSENHKDSAVQCYKTFFLYVILKIFECVSLSIFSSLV